MFLRHVPAIPLVALLACLLGSGTAFATQYTITDLGDASGPSDDICSFREAIEAIVSRTESEDCEAGTSGDIIVLPEQLAAEVLALDNLNTTPGALAEFQIGGRMTPIIEYSGDPNDHTEEFLILAGQDPDTAPAYYEYDDYPISREGQLNEDLNDDGDFIDEFVNEATLDPQVDINSNGRFDDLFVLIEEADEEEIFVNLTIRVEREDAFDNDPKNNPVIQAPANDSIFHILPRNSVTLEGVTLQGNGPVTGNGGLAVVEGTLSLRSDAMMTLGNASGDGGAVYLIEDGAVLFFDSSFVQNQATNGGAIATDAASAATITGQRSYFDDNTASVSGAAIHLLGDSYMTVTASTLYSNQAGADGGVIGLAGNSRVMQFNNVTIAGNDGGGAVAFTAMVGAGIDSLINSVFVGNAGGSCVGDGTAIDDANIAYVLHESGTCTLDQDALVQDPAGLPGDLISNDSGNADFTVLYGEGGECTAGAGSAVCTPLTLENGLKAFRPDLTDSIGTLGDSVPTAVNTGSPTDVTTNVCTARDQRNNARDDACDAGAFELAIARGRFDEVVAQPDVETVVDVAANDIGDMTFDCTAATVPADCVIIDIPPTKGIAWVDYADPDYPAGYAVIRYRSDPGIHGVDSFHYIIAQSAFPNGSTYADSDIGAQVNMVVEPERGLRSESIGGLGMVSLFVMVLLGVVRKGGKAGVLALMALVPGLIQAAEIRVNSLADDLAPVFGDDLCTLREAIGNSIDGAPFISPDCSNGSVGRDEIIIDVPGQIDLAGPLIVENGAIDIDGQGALGASATTLNGGGERIFVSSSSMTLRDMTLTGGGSAATTRGGGIFTSASLRLERVIMTGNQAQDGGAIYLNFNSTTSRTVRLLNSEFSNNAASSGSGGVLATTGANQSLRIIVDGSTFRDNTADDTGGAMDINLAPSGTLQVANSTFFNNISNGPDAQGSQADAIDLDGVSPSALVYIMNSTFVDHPLGAFDIKPDVNVDEVAPEFQVDDGFDRVDIELANSVLLNSGRCARPASGGATYAGQLFGSTSNVFAPYDASCTAVIETDVNTTAVEADVRATLNGGIVDAAGVLEDFVPSHFPLVRGTAAEADLVDAGNGDPGNLVEEYGTPKQCRALDLRGTSRTSGNRCDIGAYEVPRATAVDDSAQQDTTNRGRFVVVDVLDNDITDGTGVILTDSIDLDPLDMDIDLFANLPAQPGFPAGASVRVVQRDDTDVNCGVTTEGATTQADCVVIYEAPPNLTCDQVKTFEDSFDYTFSVSQDTATPSNGPFDKAVSGTVDISLRNVAPDAEDITVTATPGEVVVFPFIVDDPDFDEDTDYLLDVNYADGQKVSDFKLSEKPINARFFIFDGSAVYLDEGIVVDPLGGTVTYYPDNADSPFDERFTLSYKDFCGASGTTTFIIDYPENDASGDFVGGAAGLGYLFGLAGLLMRRRRRR